MGQKGNVTYCLAQSGEQRLRALIRRNRAIHENLNGSANGFAAHLIFHEGDIGQVDREWVKRKSLLKDLVFIDIGPQFRPLASHYWSGKQKHRLGYALMCRFHYYQVWDFLGEFDWALRIDSDVEVIRSLEKTSFGSRFVTGRLVNESHRLTIDSLPQRLTEIGIPNFNSICPYTNFFGTQPKFWLRSDVQEKLRNIADDRFALEFRWGDAPVIGAVIRKIDNVDLGSTVDHRIRYFHGSNRDLVSASEIKPGAGGPVKQPKIGNIPLEPGQWARSWKRRFF